MSVMTKGQAIAAHTLLHWVAPSLPGWRSVPSPTSEQAAAAAGRLAEAARHPRVLGAGPTGTDVVRHWPRPLQLRLLDGPGRLWHPVRPIGDPLGLLVDRALDPSAPWRCTATGRVATRADIEEHGQPVLEVWTR